MPCLPNPVVMRNVVVVANATTTMTAATAAATGTRRLRLEGNAAEDACVAGVPEEVPLVPVDAGIGYGLAPVPEAMLARSSARASPGWASGMETGRGMYSVIRCLGGFGTGGTVPLFRKVSVDGGAVGLVGSIGSVGLVGPAYVDDAACSAISAGGSTGVPQYMQNRASVSILLPQFVQNRIVPFLRSLPSHRAYYVLLWYPSFQ